MITDAKEIFLLRGIATEYHSAFLGCCHHHLQIAEAIYDCSHFKDALCEAGILSETIHDSFTSIKAQVELEEANDIAESTLLNTKGLVNQYHDAKKQYEQYKEKERTPQEEAEFALIEGYYQLYEGKMNTLREQVREEA